jgi:hypothetical protein
MAAAEWFLAHDGQQSGPFTAQQLKGMASAGQVNFGDLVWKQGMAGWVDATQVKGLLDTSVQHAPAASPPDSAPEEQAWAGVEPVNRPMPRPSSAEMELPEPWYYGFLEKYAKTFMWLFIGLCVLGFLGGAFITLTIGLNLARQFGLIGILWMIYGFLGGLVMFAFALLAILFLVASILLAVDAARNLRAINRKSTFY